MKYKEAALTSCRMTEANLADLAIRFLPTVLYLQYMNIKVNEVCTRAMNAFEKYLFSMKHIFPLLPF